MDRQMSAGHGVPASGIQRTKPWMRKTGSGFQVRNSRDRSHKFVTGLFVCTNHVGSDVGAGFHCGGAGLSGWHNVFGQRTDGAAQAVMDDAQMVERHPHRPIPAAVFHAGQSRNQHAARGGLRITRTNQCGNGLALALKMGVEGIAIATQAGESKKRAGNEKLDFGEASPGRSKFGFSDFVHAANMT